MTFATLLCLSFLAPAPQGNLKLPPRQQKPGASATAQRPLTEVEQFRRDLIDMSDSAPKVEAKLQELGRQHAPAVLETLIVEVARSARANEMNNLMVVARRYGTKKVADELKFQLMTRPLAEATRNVVDTMVQLIDQQVQQSGDTSPEAGSKRALQDCIRGRVTSARRPATEVLASRASVEDLPFALQLTSENSLDLQVRGVELCKAIPADEARARLIALLSKEPALAAAACEALIALREEAVPHLQKVLEQPPIDRGYAYAAFALAQVGDSLSQNLLDGKTAPPLLAKLTDREPLTRSLCAVALADLTFHSDVTSDVVFRDADVADALIEVVDGRQFVSNLDLLRRPAEQRLVRMTGRVTASEALSWRDWWKGQREGFSGIRRHVAVTAQNSAQVIVTLRIERSVVRLVAEGLADVRPIEGAQEVLLTAAQALELSNALQAGGFSDHEAMRVPSGLPLVRSLQLQVGGARAQVAMSAAEHPAFDALQAVVQAEVDRELWQLYRHPSNEPDRAAFWRAERRWFDANPDPVERGRRFAGRAITNWSVLTPSLRGRALEYLFARKDRKQLLGEADGDRLLAIVRGAAELGETELRLLELAAGVPGDRVWRECVDHAARADGGGRPAVRAVFAVLGPDAVLTALGDERPVVRRVAIDELALVRDMRGAEKLVALLDDADVEVRRTAVHACGQLQIGAARAPLIKAIAAEDTPALVRRECLRALGRIGGDHAFQVLERSLASPVSEDKEAALRGLGELRDPRAAHLLAELAVAGHGKDLGALARFYLQRFGGLMAVPALRHQVQVVTSPVIRTQLVLLLGGYQDPQNVQDLMDLLGEKQYAAEAAALLAGTTGLDLQGESDRIGAIEPWWRRNKALPQWQWLLDGLLRSDVATLLRAEHFAPSAGMQAVPELARLLVECKQPWLCVLTSAVLRTVTNQDFGVVTAQTPPEVREGIAARYRMLVEQQKAAQGK